MGELNTARKRRWIATPVAAASGEVLRFHDSAHVLRFLRERADPDQIRRLRALLPEAEVPGQRLGDDTVLRRTAERVAARTLLLVALPEHDYVWSEPAAESLAPRDVPLVPFGMKPEPPTLAPIRARLPEFSPPSNWQVDDQARVLVDAARDGVPFCELCALKPPVPAPAKAPPAPTKAPPPPADDPTF